MLDFSYSRVLIFVMDQVTLRSFQVLGTKFPDVDVLNPSVNFDQDTEQVVRNCSDDDSLIGGTTMV